MKLNYKILWVEDYPKDMQVQMGKIKQLIKNNYLLPIGLESGDAFRSYEDFIKYIEMRDEDDFSDIDLILVDYNLSDGSKRTGINIVEQLRKKNIYTDVIFYSGNIDEAIKQVKGYDGELDNVTYTDNAMDKFFPKFEKVLHKQLSLIMQISDLRGYLMDSTSDFDFVARAFVEKFFPCLTPDDKELIYNEIERCIKKQEGRETKKFEKTLKLSHDDVFVNKAMDSQEYVMTVKDKIFIMALIFQKYNCEAAEFAGDFAEQYDQKIIKYRNKLAHTKLDYGKNQSGHIKIANNLDDLECDCSKCISKLTKEECADLRKHIYEYYSFFYGLLEKLI